MRVRSKPQSNCGCNKIPLHRPHKLDKRAAHMRSHSGKVSVPS